MIIADLEKEIFKFIYDLETEDRLVRVGLKDTAESSKVFQKYKDLFTQKKLAEISSEIQSTSNKKLKESLERCYFTLAGSYIGQVLASRSDRLTTYFSKAKVKVDKEELAYFELAPKIAKEPIYTKRELYDVAASKVVEKINDKQLALLKDEIKLIKTMGFDGYLDFSTKAKKVDYHKFYKVVGTIAGKTNKLWYAVMDVKSREYFGRPFKNIRACHMGYLRGLNAFDNYYPKEKIIPTFEKFVRDLGLFDLLSSIKVDDVPRPRKNPRAVCYWANPPKEVHLIIKPMGGEQDFEATFHEGGHALHAASINPVLSYSNKMLSRSHALTETYAFILEDLVFEPRWLSKYLNVSAHTGAKIEKDAYFVNLMLLRRYLGKYMYEYEMFSSGKISAGPSLYAERLGGATGFVSRKSNWLSDMDGNFYSADYLRAWICAAQIKDYLVKKFGKEWFLNKKAGAFLRSLWRDGVTFEVEEVVQKLGYKPWDISYLVEGYRKVLEAK